jgi:hypothetical protein
MRGRDTVMETDRHDNEDSVLTPAASVDALGPLLRERASALRSNPSSEVVIGEVIAVTDEGGTPLVLYPGQPGTAAIRARSVVDIRGEHIRKAVVLAFENGDPALPIVMGVLRGDESRPLDSPGQVQVDADGERMIVTAKEQLVLRCGKASITLTNVGKVIIDGTYVVSRSSGTNRIKGGSVQLN